MLTQYQPPPIFLVGRGNFQSYILKRERGLHLVLHLALHISSTSDSNLVQALVQDLLLQSLLKVTTPLEDARRCYVEYIYTKKKKEFLTG